MLRWGYCAVLLLGGCYDPDYSHTECGPGGSCPRGWTCDLESFCEPPDSACYGTAPFTACFAAPPMAAIKVSTSTTFDTDTGTLTDTALTCAATKGGGYCIVAADTITIEALLRAVGTRPLVLVAATSIGVPRPGVIDVSSHRQSTEPIGAGADPATGCNAGMPPTTTSGTGGGGAGGSFTGDGGDGGRNVAGGIGGVHGAASGTGTGIHGGCPGQDGAGARAGAGAGGHGGGAVFLIAGNRITVDGDIMAGGAGAVGGSTESGGGGGGAGGMIGFNAGTITVTGLLVANGGGGGEGGGSGHPGNPGSDGNSLDAAPGGGPGTIGGDGGSGSAGSTSSGMKGVDAGTSEPGGGGGGGGGGAGLIKGPPGSLGPNVSPPATP